MGKIKDKSKRAAKYTARGVGRVGLKSIKTASRASKKTVLTAKKIPKTKAYKKTKSQTKEIHNRFLITPHINLMSSSKAYAWWHSWERSILKKYNLSHKQVHQGMLATYLVLIIGFFAVQFGFIFAADINEQWDFANASDYTIGNSMEINSGVARLKGQEYGADSNTMALYHLNENSGSTSNDESANNNDLTTAGSANFITGLFGNGLGLNGSNQYATASDSASLSVTGQQTIEAWINPSETFNSGASHSQTIIDKGSYSLSLDKTSGKAAYEIQNSNSEQWTKRLGDGQANGWDFFHGSVESMISYGTDIYAGTGLSRGDGEVWKWDGSSWSKIGGDGINSSWADLTYEGVYSLATNGTALYAGLGVTSGDAEVWTCDLSQGCNSWSKIGGDGNGPTTGHETILSMAVHGGNLFIGTGTSVGDGDVYLYNGNSTWTQVGGDGLNNGWAASTYESVNSLYSNGSVLYAGLGSTTGDAEIWSYNGTTWTKVGGDGLNSSWNTNYEIVDSISEYNGNLYAGLGNSSQDAEVWRLSSGTWTQVGGDGLNNGWTVNNSFTTVHSLKVNNGYLYAGVGAGTNGGMVWRYDGTNWSQSGGLGVNGSWTSHYVKSVAFINNDLYAAVSGPSGSPNNPGGAVWKYDGSSWLTIGGHYVNGSWGGYNISTVSSSTKHNGKAYFGLSGSNSAALVYEYDGTNAQLIGGNGVKNSWPVWTYESVASMTSFNGNLYAGLGTGPGDAELWSYNGTTWTKVGGDGVNSSWTSNGSVSAMSVWRGDLYIILAGNQVWRFNGTSWNRVDSGWSPLIYQGLTMTTFDDRLCIGGGGNGSSAYVYCWTGSGSWTLVGGNSVNGSWPAVTNGFVGLSNYNGKMIAASNNSVSDLNIWEYDGANWTQIGGSSVNGSWTNGSYPFSGAAPPMVTYNGSLFLGATTGGDIWRYNGSTWNRVAGGGVNNSWSPAQGIDEARTLLNYNGKIYAGLGNTANTDAFVYSFGNNAYIESDRSEFESGWTHLAASYDGVNMRIYVDGLLDNFLAQAATGVDNSLPLKLGSSFGTTYDGGGQQYFKGELDEVRISNIARSTLISKPYTTVDQLISPTTATRTSGVESWQGFSTVENNDGGSITYRLSDDNGQTWKYWDGVEWINSTENSQSNSADDIDQNIENFPVGFGGIKWQAILKGDGNQLVSLSSVNITAQSDNDSPATNADEINMFTSNGGASISEEAWSNASTPYFTWSPATDNGSGVLGYCLYLGQDDSANPTTTKGLLGSSQIPNSTSSCQFIANTTSLDLSQAELLGTALSTSNSPYFLKIRAIDRAGNIYPDSEVFEFKYDNTPPLPPTYINAPSEFVSSKEVTFTWPTVGGDSPRDNHSGVAGLQYRIGSSGQWRGDGPGGNGLLENDGSYTTRDDPDFADLNDGNNVFFFRTQDQAGNVSSSFVSATLKLNTGSPSSPRDLEVSPSSNTTNSFAFTWNSPATYAGNENSLMYCYTINTLPNANTCAWTNAGVKSLPAGAYATQPGENTFYIVAKDNNVNYATASSVTFSANTSAPGVPLNLEVADISTKATSAWKLALSWTPPTNVGAGIGSYRIMRSSDGVNFTQVATTNGSSYVDSELNQTEYSYRIKACDSANNCGADSNVVKRTPTGRFTTPANITSKPKVFGVSTKKASVSWSTDRSSDSKIAIGTKSGTYDPFQIASNAQVTDHSVELSNLTPGTTYYAKAMWTDEDGNTGSSSEFTFSTEPAPSTQEVITQRIGLSSAQIRFTSISAAKVVIQYGKSDGFGGVKEISTSLSKSTYDVEIVGLDDNTKYFYRLNTFDAEDNEYIGSTVLTFTTPARPRITNLQFQPVEGEPTSTQKITWNTNVPATSLVRFSSAGLPAEQYTNAGSTTEHEIIVKGLQDDTEYSVVAESRDAGGNLAVSDVNTLKTALDTRPPKISDITVETAIRGAGAEARGQIVVSWKTDEPASSQVAYAEGSSNRTFNNKSVEDASLATEHIVIISDLPTSRVYSVMPISRDKGQNSGEGEIKTAIISRSSDSVLTVVLNSLKKVFGF